MANSDGKILEFLSDSKSISSLGQPGMDSATADEAYYYTKFKLKKMKK